MNKTEKREDEYMREYMTYSDEMLEYVASFSIETNESDKMFVTKTALKLGLDASCLLTKCIISNDIGMLVFLLKRITDVVKVANDQSLLHLCVAKNNPIILKYFLNKDVDIHLKDEKGHTPLSLALEMAVQTVNVDNKTFKTSSKKCIGSLLEKKSKIPKLLTNGKHLFPLCIFYIIREKEKEDDITIKIMENAVEIITLKQIIRKGYMRIVHDLLIHEKLESLKILINKFPTIVNILHEKNTLLSSAINLMIGGMKRDIVDYLLSVDGIDLTIDLPDGRNYLHMFCDFLDVESIKKILEIEPKLKDLSENKPYVERVIGSNRAKKHMDRVIEIVKHLVKLGTDINKFNSHGWCALECAIQHGTKELVETLIDLGANVNRTKRYDRYHPAISNNDPVGFASQCGKLDIVKLLIEKKAITQTCTIKNQTIPTSVVQAIVFSETEILQYLLMTDDIKPYISENTKNILFDIAIKAGICDKELLQILVPKNKSIDNIVFDANYKANGVIDFMCRFVDCGITWESDPFILLHDLTSLYQNVFAFSGKYKQFIKVLRSARVMYESIISFSNIPQMELLISIISLKMHNIDSSKLNKTFNAIIEMMADETIHRSYQKELKKLQKKYSSKETSSLIEFHTLLTRVIDENRESEDDYDILENIKFSARCRRNNEEKTEEDASSKSDNDSNNESVDLSDNELDSETNDETIYDESNANISTNRMFDEKDDEIIFDQKNNTNHTDKLMIKPKNKSINGHTNNYANNYASRYMSNYMNNSMNESMNNYTNNPMILNPEKLLFRLIWPVKLDNYEYLYEQIFNNQDKLSKIDDTLTVKTKDKTIFRVNDLKTNKKPSRWFKTYARNICKDDKRDSNHTFSFALDKMLRDYGCIEEKADDTIHEGEINTLIYFSGEIDAFGLGTAVQGYFEYFINGYGTLFHRMFRPHNNYQCKVQSSKL
jgi:hypothetical protein